MVNDSGTNTAAKKESLYIVMPAYNEEGCITEVVSGWLNELGAIPGADVRMVVVNDGSRDKTGQLLDQLASRESRLIVVHQENGGHGKALRNAYEQALRANPDWVFHVDSDDQFMPRDFEQLW